MKMIIEVCKKGDPYLVKHYKNNPLEMVKAEDGLFWTVDRIRDAFNFGNGTISDLLRYIRDNKRYAAFYDTEKRCFL